MFAWNRSRSILIPSTGGMYEERILSVVSFVFHLAASTCHTPLILGQLRPGHSRKILRPRKIIILIIRIFILKKRINFYEYYFFGCPRMSLTTTFATVETAQRRCKHLRQRPRPCDHRRPSATTTCRPWTTRCGCTWVIVTDSVTERERDIYVVESKLGLKLSSTKYM